MISRNPNFLSGQQKYARQDYRGAIAEYSIALEKEENPSIYAERAVAYFHLRQFKEALNDLNTAAELEPENPYRYSSRAYVKDAMGNMNGAIEDYKRAIELDPEDAVALNNLGLLEEKAGYKEAARKRIKQADKLAEAEQYLRAMKDDRQAEKNLDAGAAGLSTPEAEAQPPSLFRTALAPLRSRKGFLEFIAFIRNGFKVDKKA